MSTPIALAKASTAPVELPELDPSRPAGPPLVARKLDLIRNVKVAMQVRVAGAELSVEELMALQAGSVVAFARRVDEPFELVLDDTVVARGEFVAVGDMLGLRVTEVGALAL